GGGGAGGGEEGGTARGLGLVGAGRAPGGVEAAAPSLLASFDDSPEALVGAPALLPNPPVALPKPHLVPAAPKADHMEWAELIASLRQDIERRRNQPVTRPRPPAPAPVRDDTAPN